MKRLGILIAGLLLSSGCVVAGGYSSGRGFFLWPGTNRHLRNSGYSVSRSPTAQVTTDRNGGYRSEPRAR